ncbi:MAG TPA: endonuclease/exonuclease/phosphatase family protein [Baekduia sp.]|nr:endonuclease/exonuclease/phosphatase family protein [Baekduia sp.]
MAVVLSWNVAGRVRSVGEQAAALAESEADVVALQEVRTNARAAWRDALGALGLVHQHYSAPPAAAGPDRRLGVVIAARMPVAPLPGPAELPWPERYAAVRVDLPDAGAVEIHALHAPISAKAERVKVLTLEAVVAALAGPGPPAVLVGDFNTPAYESREGEVRSFARTRRGSLRDGYDERHDAAELGIVPGLGRSGGWVDAFRAVHGYEARDRSWVYANRAFGYRLDHVLVRGLDVVACAYEHGWREARLSDHSAVWAAVRFPV